MEEKKDGFRRHKQDRGERRTNVLSFHFYSVVPVTLTSTLFCRGYSVASMVLTSTCVSTSRSRSISFPTCACTVRSPTTGNVSSNKTTWMTRDKLCFYVN